MGTLPRGRLPSTTVQRKVSIHAQLYTSRGCMTCAIVRATAFTARYLTNRHVDGQLTCLPESRLALGIFTVRRFTNRVDSMMASLPKRCPHKEDAQHKPPRHQALAGALSLATRNIYLLRWGRECLLPNAIRETGSWPAAQ